MALPRQVSRFEELEGLRADLHLAIGIFDGVHRGHKTVIESAVDASRRGTGCAGVLTFDPHPSHLFNPADPTRLILSLPAKARLLGDLGVEVLIAKPFDRSLAAIEADAFLPYLKAQLPALRSVYVGANFRFGKGRIGNVDTLVACGRGAGVDVYSADRLQYNGEPISSTRIRGRLTDGDIAEANQLLGYNYFSEGVIRAGAGIGRGIGFPTLNLDWVPECRPRYGVYCVQVRAAGGATWQPAVANYGLRPTVDDGSPPRLEIHCLDTTKLDRGDAVVVEWLAFVRGEQKFDSLDALSRQIAKDIDSARSFFSNA